MATGGLIVTAISAAVGAVSAQRQAETARRSETRQRGIAEQERRRQAKQESLIASREKAQAQKTAGALRATAGRRGGRRSLITGSELGTQETLG